MYAFDTMYKKLFTSGQIFKTSTFFFISYSVCAVELFISLCAFFPAAVTAQTISENCRECGRK